jgi:hypothetical protein
MRLFRRTSRNATTDRIRRGTPIDPERYAAAVAEGTHPGLPSDGRYWLMRADTYPDNETRLLWEKAATHHEARQALNEFKHACGTDLKRLSQFHHDDVDGLWGAQPRDQPYAELTITHPKKIGAEGRYHEALAALGLPPDTELEQA